MPLTRKQRELLDYLVAYIRRHRYSPTYEEIAEHFGYRSLATVHQHIRNLADKGLIRVEYHHTRSIEVMRTDDRPPPYRSVLPPPEWLREPADDYPVCPLGEGAVLPLAAVRRYRELWGMIREQAVAGDELWTFRTPEETWKYAAGRAGYALVRRGRVVDGVLTWDELREGGGLREAG